MKKSAILKAFSKTGKARGAPGIGAESPQDLHGQIRGLEAESPVFFACLRAKKMRPKKVYKFLCGGFV
jgi:hypothetical protein